MVLAAAAVIAVVTITVIVACFKATGIFIEVKDYNMKDIDKES